MNTLFSILIASALIFFTKIMWTRSLLHLLKRLTTVVQQCWNNLSTIHVVAAVVHVGYTIVFMHVSMHRLVTLHTHDCTPCLKNFTVVTTAITALCDPDPTTSWVAMQKRRRTLPLPNYRYRHMCPTDFDQPICQPMYGRNSTPPDSASHRCHHRR